MDCHFCQRNIKEVDFKDTNTLKNFVSGLGKIRPRKKTGLCAKHQRQATKSIKRARSFGLMSATEK
tara:strand:+ start:595 stop:792 length:198 start_codon:yes stop_codon:yes gene_type:complete